MCSSVDIKLQQPSPVSGVLYTEMGSPIVVLCLVVVDVFTDHGWFEVIGQV